MANRTCTKCGRAFKYPSQLRDHLKRKTPCEPIVATGAPAEGVIACRHCGRTFASKISMYRHIRVSCRAARYTKDEESAPADLGLAPPTPAPPTPTPPTPTPLASAPTAQCHALALSYQSIERKLASVETQLSELAKAMAQVRLCAPPVLPSATAPSAAVPNAAVPSAAAPSAAAPSAAVLARPRGCVIIPSSLLHTKGCDVAAGTGPAPAGPPVVELLMRRDRAEPVTQSGSLGPQTVSRVMVLDEATWRIVPLADAVAGM